MKKPTVRENLVSLIEGILVPYLATLDEQQLRETALQYALSLARERPIAQVRAWLVALRILREER